MEFYETINKRRSIRQFEDKPVPREVLERILDVAKFVKPYYCRITEPKRRSRKCSRLPTRASAR